MSLPTFADFPNLPVLGTTEKLNDLWRKDIDPLKEKTSKMESDLDSISLNEDGINGHYIINKDDDKQEKKTYLRFLNCIVTDDEENDATVVEYSERIQVNPPIIEDIVYTGEEQSVVEIYEGGFYPDENEESLVPRVNSNIINVEGVTSSLLPGTFTVIFSFKDPYNYEWSDTGDYEPREITWTMTDEPTVVSIPKQSGTLTYNGSSQQPSWTGYDSNAVTISGTTSAKNTGTYQTTFSLKNKRTGAWVDGTTADKIVTWEITKKSVSIPSISGSLIYNGNAQSPTISSYSPNEVSVSGGSAVNAGIYNIIFSLKDTTNYQWSDGTVTNKTKGWSISKALGEIILSTTSINLIPEAKTRTVSVTTVGDGNLSAESTLLTVASVNVNGKSLTITGVGNGNVAIMVYLNETENYRASTAVINVNSNIVYFYIEDTDAHSPYNIDKDYNTDTINVVLDKDYILSHHNFVYFDFRIRSSNPISSVVLQGATSSSGVFQRQNNCWLQKETSYWSLFQFSTSYTPMTATVVITSGNKTKYLNVKFP